MIKNHTKAGTHSFNRNYVLLTLQNRQEIIIQANVTLEM